MIQNFDIANTSEPKHVTPKHVTNSKVVKMLGVKMGEKGTSKKSKVSESSNKVDKQDAVYDVVPLKMINSMDIPKKITKRKKEWYW